MSIPKMWNAFVLVCLGTAIYCIVGVTFFKDLDPTNFSDFFTAMFTMYQVLLLAGAGALARGPVRATNKGHLGRTGQSVAEQRRTEHGDTCSCRKRPMAEDTRRRQEVAADLTGN